MTKNTAAIIASKARAARKRKAVGGPVLEPQLGNLDLVALQPDWRDQEFADQYAQGNYAIAPRPKDKQPDLTGVPLDQAPYRGTDPFSVAIDKAFQAANVSPVDLASALWEMGKMAVTAPKRAYDEGMTTDRAIKEAANVAMTVPLMSAAPMAAARAAETVAANPRNASAPALAAAARETKPIRAYHGSSWGLGKEDKFIRDPNFSNPAAYSDPEIGPHFGSIEQAENRFVTGIDASEPRVYPVDLRFKKIIDLPDASDWTMINSGLPRLQALKRKGHDDPELMRLINRTKEARQILKDVEKGEAHHSMDQYVYSELEPKLQEDFLNYLESKGYDGIRYRNKHEGKGYSYIPIKRGTVKSAITGETLFANQRNAAAPAVVAAAQKYLPFGNEPFVARQGTTNLGNFNSAAAKVLGVKPGPIRMAKGNANYGEQHIQSRHGNQLGPYKTVSDLIADAARGFTKVHLGNDGNLMLVKPLNNRNSAVAVVRPANNEWRVVSGGINDNNYINRRDLIWSKDRRLYSNPDEAAAPAVVAAAHQMPGMDLYHGTYNRSLSRFNDYHDEFGPHIGTREQAQSRIDDFPWRNEDNGTIIPLKADFKKSAEMRDRSNWNPLSPSFVDELQNIPGMEYKDVAPLYDLIDYVKTKNGQYKFDQAEKLATDYVRAILQEKGYDSIAYHNRYEGPGLSYIPVKRNTVRNANTGAVMYTNPKEAAAPAVVAAAQRAEPFYSQLASNVSNSKMAKAPPDQWLSWMRNQPGIKGEELEWTGLEQWLGEQKGPVTKAQVEDYLKNNAVRIEEKMLGETSVHPDILIAYEDIRKATAENILSNGDAATMEEALQLADDFMEPGDLQGVYEDIALDMGIPKEEVHTYIGNPTRYNREKLLVPGGENYRELLLKMPEGKGTGRYHAEKLGEGNNQWAVINSDTGQIVNDNIHFERQAREFAESYTKQGKAPGDHFAKAAVEPFSSSHWDDKNVLAHVRFDDRVDAAGKKTLFLQEVQSDWHQIGRKQGYTGPKIEAALIKEYNDWLNKESLPHMDVDELLMSMPDGMRRPDIVKKAGEFSRKFENLRMGYDMVPDAPFKATTAWTGMALKRMIRMAAENGYDQIAWTPGKIQKDRYNLAKHVSKLTYMDDSSSKGRLQAYDHNGHLAIDKYVDKAKLGDYVGQEIAEKLLNAPKEYIMPSVNNPRNMGWRHSLTGQDLEIGGKGMIDIYDKMLVDHANKLGKKFGAKVGRSTSTSSADWAPIKVTVEKIGDGDNATFNVVEHRPNGRFSQSAYATLREAEEAAAFTRKQWEGSKRTHDMWTLPITPALREEALGKGFSLFANPEEAALPAVAAAAAREPRPIRAYHGTTGDLGQFHNTSRRTKEVGPHFGTTKAAEEALLRQPEGAKSIIPVDMKFKKVLTVPDLNNWNVDNFHNYKFMDWSNWAPEKRHEFIYGPGNVEKDAQGHKMYNWEGRNQQEIADYKAQMIKDHLIGKGYDAIRYKNKFEDKGSWSYIPLKRGTVKSSITGETLFSNPEEAALPSVVAAAQRAEPFYSKLSSTVDSAKMNKAQPQQWLAWLRNNGAKAEELEWTGLEKWLGEQSGPVTKAQVQEHVKNNQVKLEETLLGQPARSAVERAGGEEAWSAMDEWQRQDFRDQVELNTKFNRDDLVLPGGENYRELLLKMPPSKKTRTKSMEGPGEGEYFNMQVSDDFRGSHWDDHNVLAHVRFNDRTDTAGNKTLFLEEVQSDWHQKGRKEGYKSKITKKEYDDAINKHNEIVTKITNKHGGLLEGDELLAVLEKDPEWVRSNSEIRKMSDMYFDESKGVPNAPFKTTWPELALKRMIRWAAEHGYDQIGWTPGKVQADRYNLSKQVSQLNVTKNDNGTFTINARPVNARDDYQPILVAKEIPKEKLDDVVGKELASKISAQTEKHFPYYGDDLQVGGEGMKSFYDKMLVSKANDIGKKYGAKVQKGDLHSIAKATIEKYGDEWALMPNDGSGDMFMYPTKESAEQALRKMDKGKPHPESRGSEMWTLPITPALRKAAMEEGFALFANEPKASIGISAVSASDKKDKH